MDSTLETLTVAVDDEISHVSYFLGYDRPPFDNEKEREDAFHVTFKGRVTYPDEFVRLRCEIELSPTKGDERKKWDKQAIIGTLTITPENCRATLNLDQESVGRVLQHYFLFREPDSPHFHISLEIKDVQVVEGKKWCRISKLISGWGD